MKNNCEFFCALFGLFYSGKRQYKFQVFPFKAFLQEFIHEDQYGFLHKRQLKENVRIVLGVIEQHNEKQAALIF